MTLAWDDINIEVVNRNTRIKQKYLDIIKRSSGVVKNGEILAIMGPSGGGKTTLLNALAGRIAKGSKTQGRITYNNKIRNKDEWIRMAGFVDQDDIVHESLTIKETFNYAAEFRSKRAENKIERIINDLNLGNVSCNEMEKVSGGERKRSMIGIELVSNPEMLFLDEPTSGLDTLTALKICKILKKLAVEEQRIVVLSIHQPSLEIFLLFDWLLLLSQGNSVYYGRVKDVESYFSDLGMTKRKNTTLPEFLVEICSDDYRKDNPQFFYNEESIFKDDIVMKDESIRKSRNDFYINFKPKMEHVLILLARRFKIETHRKFKFIKPYLFKSIFYAFLIIFNFMISYYGLDPKINEMDVFRDIKKASIRGTMVSTTITIIIFNQTSSSITAFYHENAQVSREIAVESYSTASYYLSILIYQIISESVLPILSLIPMYIFVNFRDLTLYSVFLFSAFFSVPFGICVGSISSTKSIVMVLSSFLGMVSALPLNVIYLANKTFGFDSQGRKNNLKFLTFLFAFITPHYYISFMVYMSYWVGYNTLSKLGLPPLMLSSLENPMVAWRSYIDCYAIPVPILFLLMVLTPFICTFLGIFLMGLNLMPEIRMELEKQRIEKSK